MADDTPQDKKIIVDEDWKSQVEAEKEAAEHGGEARETQGRGPMPPASLSLLITELAAQASIAFGDVAHPATGKPEVDPELAKHAIDMLDVLERKTQGNLDPNEKQLLDTLLFQLRMRYVGVASPAGPDPQEPTAPSS